MKAAYPASFDRDAAAVWVSDKVSSLTYSDGYEAETRMLRQMTHLSDVTALSQELRALAVDWPTTYHYSPRRASLLRPFHISSELSVLEIGAGCGAITRYLGETDAHVVALEGTYRRAAIAAARTCDLPNVRVIAAPLDDIYFTEQFDLVLLVGVLEYAAMYNRHDGDPYERLLERCTSLLSPGGVLLVAIENRLGVKYFGGAAEDHTGYAYLGIDGAYGDGGPRTFALEELVSLINRSGLGSVEVLTPLPDYKLVRSIIRWSHVPKIASNAMAQFVASSFYEDPQHQHVPPFSLEQVGASLVDNDLATSLGSSFLVVASRSSDGIGKVLPEGPFAWYYAVDRQPRFTKVTVLEYRDGVATVRREPLCATADDAPEAQLHQRLENEDFFPGRSVWLAFVSAMNKPDWTVAEAAASLIGWADTLRAPAERSGGIEVVPGDFLDHVPFNTVDDNGIIHVFDLEWRSTEELPLLWVALRGLLFSLEMITSLAEPDEGVPLQVGPLACAIADELFGTRGDYNLGRDVGFLEWLASVQATAGGRTTERAYSQLVDLWESSLVIRDRPAHVNALELNPHVNASEY